MKKRAFTLAEVLITLGIIGVVAAMTIPTLMQKTNDKELVSGTLKMGSVLSNALKTMEAKDMVWVDKIEDLDTFNAKLAGNLNTVKCDDHTVCLSDGSYFDYINDNFGGACTKENPCVEIVANINGQKGPDKQGKDIYKFLVTKNGILPAGEQTTCSGLDCTAYVLATHKLWDGEINEVNITAQQEEVAIPHSGDSCSVEGAIYDIDGCQFYKCDEGIWTYWAYKGCS